MKIERLEYNSLVWEKAIEFAENCSWIAGKHIAREKIDFSTGKPFL